MREIDVGAIPLWLPHPIRGRHGGATPTSLPNRFETL